MKDFMDMVTLDERLSVNGLVPAGAWLAVFAIPSAPFWKAVPLIGFAVTDERDVVGLYAKGPVVMDAGIHRDFLAYVHEDELTADLQRELAQAGRHRYQAVGTAPVVSIARRREA